MNPLRVQIVKDGDEFIRRHKAGDLKTKKDLVLAISNKWYRLNALYKIKNKNGKVVTFKPNIQQRQRFEANHCQDIILKSRQLGFTTFEMIDSLDDCLWIKNFSAGCIAHTLVDAQDIFRNKVKFAYDQLNKSSSWRGIFKEIGLKLPIPASDKGDSYVFDNGSSIKVSTSYRGGTLQRLHVSEFGKICRKYPDKAQEIVTGAFEAVGFGNQITLESTAEGREGYFFKFCESGRKLQQTGKNIGQMDWNFHFFPWYEETSYFLDPKDVDIPSWLHDYFGNLRTKGIDLSPGQQAWYAKKAEKLLDDMQREYPSTPEEAFAQNVEGAYFAKQMSLIREKGRITKKVVYNPSLPVITGWDLGISDAMSIVFAQVVGREVHIIDYLEHSGEGLEYYADELRKKGYHYSYHYGPHDLAVRELGNSKSRLEAAAEFGIKFEIVPRIANHAEGIQAVRTFLPVCWFTESTQTATYSDKVDGEDDAKQTIGVDRLIDCLDSYRKEWDDKKGIYKTTPRHDWASHGAKAFETLARAGVFNISTGTTQHAPVANTSRGKTRWGAHT
jgi:hypothetical protein